MEDEKIKEQVESLLGIKIEKPQVEALEKTIEDEVKEILNINLED